MNTNEMTREALIGEVNRLRQRIKELESRDEIADLLLQNPSSLAIKITTGGNITFLNDYSRIFLGGNVELTGSHFLGSVILDVPENRDAYTETLERVILEPESYVTFEARIKKPDGREAWLEWTLRAFSDQDYNITEIICLGSDITHNKKVENELKKAATTDLVTGLYARNSFVESVDREIYRFNRYGKSFSLIFSSILNYQECFDEFDQDYIDSQLKDMAELFKDSLRMSDIICRWSSEEFAVMLPETDTIGVRRAAEKIRDSVQAALDDQRFEIPFRLAFCVTEFEKGKTLDGIVNSVLDSFDEISSIDRQKIEIVTIS